MYVERYSAWTVLHDFALRIPVEWLVRILLLTSMTLQVILVVLGARRYLSSSGILRFLVWGAYISTDAVAISALGTMMHSARRGIYGIWAPVLLMHLGGPDAISAYSMADNELWLRHGFNMVYQVGVTGYIIYGSSLKGDPLAAAILLSLVGFAKYAERTLALWYGSYSRIVMSSLPVSKFMEIESVVKKCQYVVMGENQLERIIEQQQPSTSPNGRGIQRASETSSSEETGIQGEIQMPSPNETRIQGEIQMPSQHETGRQEQLERSSQEETGIQEELEGGEIVTIEDVKIAGIKGRGYDLCLSHALFKMYKRRFGSLYFHEGDWKETRDFWVKRFTGKEAFRLAEMELKFMYDAVFSKYSNTGFTKSGMILRFLITVLLGVAGYLILEEKESRQAQQMVTYIVISVAFVVEVFQISRVMMSDWTRVHLICAYVVAYGNQKTRSRESHSLEWCTFCQVLQPYTFCHILQCCCCRFCHILQWYWCRFCLIFQWCKFQVIKITIVVVGTFQDLVGGNRYLSKIVGGNRYWSNRIPQHCLIETWPNKSPIICKMAGLFPKPERYIVDWYAEIRHVHRLSVEDDLKDFIFEILRNAFNEEKSSEECRKKIYNFEKDLFQGESEIQEILKSHTNLEEVILIWHIATTLCDRERGSPQNNETEKNVKLSKKLSRYCAYLLLSRPNLLPLHPKMARIVYMQLVNQLLDTLTVGSILQNTHRYLLRCNEKHGLLGSGIKLAHNLLKKNEKGMWELLAQYWGKLVIYMAVYNKAIFHAECVAAGGEFLSLVWVLLAHMGCGEQSDSAVTKKVEMPSDKELTVGERSAEQDPAEMREKLETAKKVLNDRVNDLENLKKELERVKKDFNDRESAFTAKDEELDAMKKDLSDREKELAARREGSSNPEEELIAMKKIVHDLEEELSSTRKILRDREDDFAAMKKNLLLRKGNFE
ncbi:hypothetical protein SUGI_0390520 [Cryptomeria japonica]|nr:hypothetical protein SUGI_0390520 [Cryptomeria japonica]